MWHLPSVAWTPPLCKRSGRERKDGEDDGGRKHEGKRRLEAVKVVKVVKVRDAERYTTYKKRGCLYTDVVKDSTVVPV